MFMLSLIFISAIDPYVYSNVGHDFHLPSPQYAVTFNVPPDMSALENIQPIEAINYFVELEVERHLERLKMAAVKEQRREKEEENKNTVLVLPKIRRLVLYLFSHNSFTFLSFRYFMVMLPHWFSLVCVCNENLSFIKKLTKIM